MIEEEINGTQKEVAFNGSVPKIMVQSTSSFRSQSHQRLLNWKTGGYDSERFRNELKMKSKYSDQSARQSSTVLKSAILQNPKLLLNHLDKKKGGHFSRFNSKLTKKGSYHIKKTESN